MARDRPGKSERIFVVVPLFAGLSGQETGRVLRIAQEIPFREGEDLYQPGDDSAGFYMVLDGRVELRSSVDSSLVVMLGSRSVLGHCSFLAGRQRPDRARCVEETRLNWIARVMFNEMLDKGDLAAYKIAMNMARAMSSRVLQAEHVLVDAWPV